MCVCVCVCECVCVCVSGRVGTMMNHFGACNANTIEKHMQKQTILGQAPGVRRSSTKHLRSKQSPCTHCAAAHTVQLRRESGVRQASISFALRHTRILCSMLKSNAVFRGSMLKSNAVFRGSMLKTTHGNDNEISSLHLCKA